MRFTEFESVVISIFDNNNVVRCHFAHQFFINQGWFLNKIEETKRVPSSFLFSPLFAHGSRAIRR